MLPVPLLKLCHDEPRKLRLSYPFGSFRIPYLPLRRSLKDFGSQGEKKFFHYVLKLAEGDFITKKSGKTPALLLDDLFAKIDTL